MLSTSNTNSITNFTIEKKLGEGSFSEVYRVKRKADGAIYAMKKVKMGKLTGKEKDNSLNEVRILASVNHVNVIGYKEAFFEDSSNTLCVVMEYADGGDLLQLINEHKKKNTNFNEKQIWHFFIQIIRGLKALHDLKICHRDIKCANVFLTKDHTVKLGDLNVSKVNKGGLLRTQTGTPYYACPEVWKDMPYDHRSDIWSVGCVLYEIITKLPPFRASTMKGLYSKVLSGKYEQIPSMYSDDLKKMLKSCLQVRSSDRPNCNKILAMPGLLNHLTGTLENMQELKTEEQESLMKTIRMPRRMAEVTNRLPAPQYDSDDSHRNRPSGIKRTSSTPAMKLGTSIETVTANKSSLQQIATCGSSSSQVRKKEINTLNPNAKIGVSRSVASLKLTGQVNPVEVESHSLIQKAHELYNVKSGKQAVKSTGSDSARANTPEKLLSLADRAARNYPELPTIEETADKENDTFAQGGPMAALAHPVKIHQKPAASKDARSRSGLRSADNNQDKYRMYREPGDRNSVGIGQIVRAAAALPPKGSRQSQLNRHSQLIEAMTPNAPISKANDLISHQHLNAESLVLPRIQSSRHSQVSSSVNGLGRINSRQRLQQNMNPNLRNYSRGEESYEARRNKPNPLHGGSRHRQNNHLYNYMNGAPKASDLSQQLDSLTNSPSSLGIGDRHLRQIRSRSNQAREEFSALQASGAGGLVKRSDQSCLDHIRRIRRNMPSQQNSRQSHNMGGVLDHSALALQGAGQNYVSQPAQGLIPSSRANSKLENYRRIKAEEAAARQQLRQPTFVRASNNGMPLRSQASNVAPKYKPSANALASYSPLRSDLIPTNPSDGIISSRELQSLRGII